MASQNRNHASDRGKAVVDIPDSVITIGTPTAGAGQVSVAFTASSPSTGGPVTKYTAVSNPDSITGTATSSPVVVTGLTNGTAYTFTVAAGNSTGNGVFSAASASATPIDPASFESIATSTVGAGGVSSITFSSIPSTYKHLQIRGIVRGNSASTIDVIKMTFNSDTSSSNYVTLHQIYGSGSSAAAQSSTGNGWIYQSYLAGNSAGANVFGAYVTDILDYTSTNKNKTTRTLAGIDNNGGGYVTFGSGLWMNSSTAINRIDLEIESSTFRQYSSIALYGIKG